MRVFIMETLPQGSGIFCYPIYSVVSWRGQIQENGFRDRRGTQAKGGRSMKHLMRFLRDEEGATAVEYGIMVAAIAAVIITVVIAVGGKTNDAFEKVNGAMDGLT